MGAPLSKGALTPRAIILLAIAAVVLGSATLHRLVFADLPGPLFEFAGETMGTTFVVKVAAESLAPEDHEGIATRLRERLAELNGALSNWDPDSEVSRLNAHQSTDPFPVGEDLDRVLGTAWEVSEASGGAFDATVRPLVQAWGFGDNARVPGGPSAVELGRLRERVGYQRVSLLAGEVTKSRPDVVVDLSAIAKGYAVDALSRELSLQGYEDHLVEIGGEITASGRRPDGSPWRLAIEQPDVMGREVHRVLEVSDLGMATSGDYRTYYEQDGVRISHTIDPRTGYPIGHGLASVTVLHPEAMVADAWATALNVQGPEAGYRLATFLELPAYFIIRRSDGTFETRATPTFPASGPVREP